MNPLERFKELRKKAFVIAVCSKLQLIRITVNMRTLILIRVRVREQGMNNASAKVDAKG